MTPLNLLLIVLSACIHVVAHLALRRATHQLALVWWILLWGGLLFSPLLVFGWQPISPQAWGVMALSAGFEALYYYAIAKAYAAGDEISIIYPLARGIAPVLLLIWAVAGLREQPKPGGVLGVLVIAGGLYCVNLPRLGAWREPVHALARSGPRWALLAGLCISLYSVVDRVGISLLDPLIYIYLTLWLAWGCLTPFVFREVGWARLKTELHASGWRGPLAGFTTLAAYVLVLYAILNGTPASYAGAAREISVVLGVIAGVGVLKENGTAMKFVGAAGVVLGVALIKLLG